MKKILQQVLVLVLIISSLPQITLAKDEINPAFDPNMIISDAAFSDVGTFGSAGGIQKFLEVRKSALANTSPDFLIKLKEPDTLTKVGLEDPEPNLSRLRTAAELIYDASKKTGLNPQVILVILEKEQSLITGKFDDATLQRRLDRALGFGCPDYEGCGDIFLGFYRQMYGTFDSSGSRWLGAATSLMRSFNTEVDGKRVGRGPGVDAQNRTFGRPVVKTSRKGDTITFDNTLGGFDGVKANQTVTLSNYATAALYRYTPHVFNGNYNFWRLYHTWFKYSNGTVIKLQKDDTLYVIDNGSKRAFSATVAAQRKIKIDNVITVSKNEFEEYVTDKPMPPLDGTLLKGDKNSAVYLIQDTKKRAISGPVFAQRQFSFANVVTVPQAEVDSYDQGGAITPLNGTLISGEKDLTVYLIDGDLKRPISYEVFVARKFSFKNVMKLDDLEVSNMPSGGFVYPPDQVAIKLKGDTGIYWFRDNQKRPVSAFVYEQRGVSTFPHMELGADEINSIPTSTQFPPRDGTIIQGDQSTGIYQIQGGLKHLLTLDAYKRLRTPKATILPQAEVDAYAAGDIIAK